jgi:hypothetical protein
VGKSKFITNGSAQKPRVNRIAKTSAHAKPSRETSPRVIFPGVCNVNCRRKWNRVRGDARSVHKIDDYVVALSEKIKLLRRLLQCKREIRGGHISDERSAAVQVEISLLHHISLTYGMKPTSFRVPKLTWPLLLDERNQSAADPVICICRHNPGWRKCSGDCKPHLYLDKPILLLLPGSSRCARRNRFNN